MRAPYGDWHEPQFAPETHLGKPIIFVLALAGPYAAYRLFRLTRPTARLFLAQT